MQTVDPIDLGDPQLADLGIFDPIGQRPSRSRGGADGIKRQHDPCEPPSPQFGAAMRANARLLSAPGLGEPRREPPELDQPPRNHPPPIEHGTKPTADGAPLEATVADGVQVVVGEPARSDGPRSSNRDEPAV